MQKYGRYHIQEEERLQSLIELIAEDLKVHKFLKSRSHSNRKSTFEQLQQHNQIFEKVGFNRDKINPTLKDWYFQMINSIIDLVDFTNDEILFTHAAKILVELNSKKFELY